MYVEQLSRTLRASTLTETELELATTLRREGAVGSFDSATASTLSGSAAAVVPRHLCRRRTRSGSVCGEEDGAQVSRFGGALFLRDYEAEGEWVFAP